jgi:uncharacterized protein YcnI
MRKGRIVGMVVAVATAGAVVFGASAAGAHVTVQPGTQKKGASDALVSFAVPNESTTGASTTQVEIDFPASTPLLGVHAQTVAGWTAKVETTKLAKPVTTDDGEITEAVSKVTWTANDASTAIGPDQFGLFTVIAGTLPSNTGKVTFKAIQTYSDGSVVSWIEPTVKGAPAPEHPTPVLKLVGKA